MTLRKTLHHVFINSYEWNLFQHLRIIWNLSQQKVTVLLFIHLLFLCIRRLLYVDFSSLNCKIRNPRSPDHKRRIGHGWTRHFWSVFLQPGIRYHTDNEHSIVSFKAGFVCVINRQENGHSCQGQFQREEFYRNTTGQ